ncbi:MAG: hypothetical protein JWM80_3775 [Cyanobacteria bacterium RYN_339]|nr:hypothetical protein [Cyanobacteria bacterium RYN_339]
MGMIGVNALAKRIIGMYDRNRDGAIQLTPDNKAETWRRESIYQPDQTIISTYSQERLFRAADKNGDNVVTAEELSTVIGEFDTNHNNGLETRRWLWDPRTEYDHFRSAWGEEVIGEVIVPHPQPPAPPIPYPPHPHMLDDQATMLA